MAKRNSSLRRARRASKKAYIKHHEGKKGIARLMGELGYPPAPPKRSRSRKTHEFKLNSLARGIPCKSVSIRRVNGRYVVRIKR